MMRIGRRSRMFSDGSGLLTRIFAFHHALERKILRHDAHEMITADGRLPVALDQFRIALDKRFARHRDAVGPAMGFVSSTKS